ncbi:MAG: DUF937 domain-containing protein [Gammaproteobacteria bacterium]
MNILDTILAAGGGDAVTQLARQFGTQPQATQSALSQIVSVLGKGIAANTATQGGLDGLLGALAGGNHARYIDDLAHATSANGINDGNGILGHILGGKDVSRELATRVGSNTGVSSTIIQQMLPVIASMMMGALSKQQSGGGLGGLIAGAAAKAALGSGQSPLGSLLGGNHAGSMADDIIGMASKLLRP